MQKGNRNWDAEIHALCDSGAPQNSISPDYAEDLGLHWETYHDSAEAADEHRMEILGRTSTSVRWKRGGVSEQARWPFFILKGQRKNISIGWLYCREYRLLTKGLGINAWSLKNRTEAQRSAEQKEYERVKQMHEQEQEWENIEKEQAWDTADAKLSEGPPSNVSSSPAATRSEKSVPQTDCTASPNRQK